MKCFAQERNGGSQTSKMLHLAWARVGIALVQHRPGDLETFPKLLQIDLVMGVSPRVERGKAGNVCGVITVSLATSRPTWFNEEFGLN